MSGRPFHRYREWLVLVTAAVNHQRSDLRGRSLVARHMGDLCGDERDLSRIQDLRGASLDLHDETSILYVKQFLCAGMHMPRGASPLGPHSTVLTSVSGTFWP